MRTIVGVALALIASLGVREAAGGQEAGDGLLPPGEWTAAEEDYLLDLIERTEAALPRYRHPDLLPEGFRDAVAVAPGGFHHWVNSDWIDDGHVLDPEYPESVVYRATQDPTTGEDVYELVTAMFSCRAATT